MQWITDGEVFHLCETDKLNIDLWVELFPVKHARKATLTDLQERFKEKER